LWKPENTGQVLERRIVLVAASEEAEKLGLLCCKGNGFMQGTVFQLSLLMNGI